MLLYVVAWTQTDFECLPGEKHSLPKIPLIANLYIILDVHKPISAAGVVGLMRRILYKSVLVRSPYCSRRRRIDENSDTPVAFDQYAVNCLGGSVHLFSTMQTMCLSSHVDVTVRGPLPYFRVVLFL